MPNEITKSYQNYLKNFEIKSLKFAINVIEFNQ